MTQDPRARLSARRAALLEGLKADRAKMAQSYVNTPGHAHAARAAYDKEATLDKIDAALAQAELTQALQTETAARAAAQADQENFTFWFRRFMLSLQIGNGAGFIACVAAIPQASAEELAGTADVVLRPALYFGIATVVSGLLPLVMAGQASDRIPGRAKLYAARFAVFLAMMAAICFAFGVAAVVAELAEARDRRTPTHAADPAPPSPSPAPPPPAGDPSGSPAG